VLCQRSGAIWRNKREAGGVAKEVSSGGQGGLGEANKQEVREKTVRVQECVPRKK